MDILIKNCNLISMNEKEEKYQPNMDIYINDSKIEKIGKNIEIENVKIIDAKNKIVMPGLINTHSHIGMSIFRETIDGYGLQEWLETKIWPVEDKLTGKDIYYATLLSGIEMIKTGTTTINDMYFFADEIIEAANFLGIRLQTTRTLMNLVGNGSQKLNELEALIKKYNNKYDNITLNIGIHGLYTNDEDYIKKGIKLAQEHNLPIHMHFCENAKEVEDIRKVYGIEPIEILEKFFERNHVILAHCVKLTNEDIMRLRNLNMHISHCPISNLRLGCGVAKVNELIRNNINVSLGTDGQGSGSNLDMFETMKCTSLLQKGIYEDPKALNAYEVLKMATINGAKALGLDSKIGSIEEGRQADIIILNLENEVLQPVNDIFSDIVYNAKGSNVETTIINGEILMETRHLNKINEREIYIKCKEIVDKAWQ